MELTQLGHRIQSLRLARGLTLQGLAEAAGVSVGMLHSVEHGHKAPTVLVLDRIAGGLGVPLPSLVASLDDGRIVVRRAAAQDVIHESGGWQRTILSPVIPGVNFEWIRSTLPPGCDAGSYPAYAPGSHEFLVVGAGRLRLTLGERVVDLGAGDSVYFAADVVHGYANPGGVPCTYDIVALIMRPRLPAGGRPPRG